MEHAYQLHLKFFFVFVFNFFYLFWLQEFVIFQRVVKKNYVTDHQRFVSKYTCIEFFFFLYFGFNTFTKFCAL